MENLTWQWGPGTICILQQKRKQPAHNLINFWNIAHDRGSMLRVQEQFWQNLIHIFVLLPFCWEITTMKYFKLETVSERCRNFPLVLLVSVTPSLKAALSSLDKRVFSLAGSAKIWWIAEPLSRWRGGHEKFPLSFPFCQESAYGWTSYIQTSVIQVGYLPYVQYTCASQDVLKRGNKFIVLIHHWLSQFHRFLCRFWTALEDHLWQKKEQ